MRKQNSKYLEAEREDSRNHFEDERQSQLPHRNDGPLTKWTANRSNAIINCRIAIVVLTKKIQKHTVQQKTAQEAFSNAIKHKFNISDATKKKPKWNVVRPLKN